MKNKVTVFLEAHSVNEGLARAMVAAFASRLDPTLEELADIKTAVSEAVTNAIIHGYDGEEGIVTLSMQTNEKLLTIIVSDTGCGIQDVRKAMQPLYTRSAHPDRSGMGFTVMESFMDSVDVASHLGAGTTVMMTKKIHG